MLPQIMTDCIKYLEENNYIIKDIIFEDDNQQHHYFEKVKLHKAEEILEIAEKIGFSKAMPKTERLLHVCKLKIEKTITK